jgi:hypothetical protein
MVVDDLVLNLICLHVEMTALTVHAHLFCNTHLIRCVFFRSHIRFPFGFRFPFTPLIGFDVLRVSATLIENFRA